MEAADSSEMVVTTHKNTQRHPQPKSYFIIN
jgi:hypothetical protein